MPSKTSKKRKQVIQKKDDVQDIFREMLLEAEAEAEAEAKSKIDAESSRIKKKVKMNDRPANIPDSPIESLQTVYNSSESEDDLFWEDVDVDANFNGSASPEPQSNIEPISIVFQPNKAVQKTKKKQTRKPLTAAERSMRVEVHKTHILCLLSHCMLRNHWCNNKKLQTALRNSMTIPSKVLNMLHPNTSAIQFSRSRTFKEGLTSIFETWKDVFDISIQGLWRPHWDQVGDLSNVESFLDVHDFIDHLNTWSGSHDYGAQLFCALLRALGVETRLVCSLQVLPFAPTATMSVRQRAEKSTIYIDRDVDDYYGPRSHYLNKPIWWVEVLDEAYQKWIPLDPLITQTVGKSNALEPDSMTDPTNFLSYVIAFEPSGVAKDVTRRYTKAFVAKTRKTRIDDKWFNRVMNCFRRKIALDRDQIEDAQLLQKQMSEGMPKKVDDFKGHPVYVLERHLRQNEVIHPKKEAGKINTGGKLHNVKMEAVYRRENVHVVRSADKWFRLGRRIKFGEIALKRTVQRNQGQRDITEQELVPLYAGYQTELYIPDPVKNGVLPKNRFGNIDVYVPSMIPAGGIHIKSRHGKQAARILGIKYADAVTGFNFSGRHGTAIVNGVIVAEEYEFSMLEVLTGLAYARQQDLRQQKQIDALILWRKFVLGLNIIERVKRYKKDEEEEVDDEFTMQDNDNSVRLVNDENEIISDLDDIDVVRSTRIQPTPNQIASFPSDIMAEEPRNLQATIRERVLVAKDETICPQQKSPVRLDIVVPSPRQPSEYEDYDTELSAKVDSEHDEIILEDPDDEDAEPDWLM